MPINLSPAPTWSLAPYDPQTRPWYLDTFWRHFKGKGFNASSGSAVTTIGGTGVLANQVLLPAVSTTGFLVGDVIVVGSGTNWQTFEIDTVNSSTQLTVLPRTKVGGFLSTDVIDHAWANDNHPGTVSSATNGYTAFAQSVSDALQHRTMGGFNRLTAAVGDIASSGTTVPTGWTAIGTAAFLSTTYTAGGAEPHARSGTGVRIGATAIGDGMGTAVAIPVTAGERLVLSAMAAELQGTGFQMQVVDFTTPTTIIAQLTNLIGTPQWFNWVTMGSNVYLPFTVPVGTTSIQVRFVGTAASDFCYVDDVRLLANRQDPTLDRFVIEDPGDKPIVAIGDSWGSGGVHGFTVPLQAALTARLGKQVTVINSCISGQRLDQMNARFTTDVLAYRPAYCIYEYGANDLAAARSQALMEADIDLAIDNCRKNGIIPIFLGVPPITSVIALSATRNDQLRARVDRINL